jgi:hypothetical protein
VDGKATGRSESFVALPQVAASSAYYIINVSEISFLYHIKKYNMYNFVIAYPTLLGNKRLVVVIVQFCNQENIKHEDVTSDKTKAH